MPKRDGTLLTTVCVLGVLFVSVLLMGVLASASRTREAMAAPQDGVRLPILMYHSILEDRNQWGTYVISPGELENDLKYLSSNGYTAVTVQDLIDAVYNGAPLPPKPVMLTFDDGYYNNYLYAYPLLQKYHMKAVLSIIGRYTDQYSLSGERSAAYSHVTWDQVNEMIDSGLVEVQNHSYNLHTIGPERTASMKVSGESPEHYREALMSDVLRLQAEIDRCTKRLPEAYTYPFGLISKESVDILKDMGFKASFTCYSGINRITGDPSCLFMMKRMLRTHGTSASSLLAKYLK